MSTRRPGSLNPQGQGGSSVEMNRGPHGVSGSTAVLMCGPWIHFLYMILQSGHVCSPVEKKCFEVSVPVLFVSPKKDVWEAQGAATAIELEFGEEIVTKRVYNECDYRVATTWS